MSSVVFRMDFSGTCHEIISMDIVPVTVAVVIHARLAIQFRLVSPDISGDVRMVIIHTAVENRHDDIAVAEHAVLVPGFLQFHVNAFAAATLSGIVIMPLDGIVRVIHLHICLHRNIDRFNMLNANHFREIGGSFRNRLRLVIFHIEPAMQS